MKAFMVSVLLCLVCTYMTTAEVTGVAAEAPVEAENSVPEDAQGFEAVAPADNEGQDRMRVTESVMAEVPEDSDDETAAARMFCPPGWFNYRSRCYLYVSSQMTWINAEKHCVNQQAALASVQNPEEYQFLQSLANVAGRSNAWLGGFYFQGTWMWIDRTAFIYNNWLSPASTTHYQCIFMRSSGGWSNTNCASNLPFFCVRSPNSCN